jgi:isocitrate lyase
MNYHYLLITHQQLCIAADLTGRPAQQCCCNRCVCLERIFSSTQNTWISSSLAELAARYKTDGMLAYVELVQRKEKEIGCDVLTHQKW